MSPIGRNLKKLMQKCGIFVDTTAQEKEIQDCKRIISGLIKEAENGLDLKIAKAEIEQRIADLESKLGIRKPYPGVG